MSLFVPKQVLVTGGAGFIGSNFIRYLLNKKDPPFIVNLDALTYAGSSDNLKNLPCAQQYHFIKGDITDRTLIDRILRDYAIDTLVHFAAESHVDRSISGPSIFIQTNLIGTFTLLEAARQYWLEEKKWDDTQCLFHHISTDEVYGSLKTENPPFTESTPYCPRSPYSASKAGSDHLAKAYAHTYALPITVTNCSNNYGPYQHLEKFIPTIISSCLAQKPIPVYGDGSNIRDWLYVEDHCRGIDCVIQQGRRGETYNIGGNNEWSNLNIALKICELLDKLCPQKNSYSSLITFVSDRPGHDWRYAVDTSKIQQQLGWQPEKTFDTGILKTIQFYLAQISFKK